MAGSRLLDTNAVIAFLAGDGLLRRLTRGKELFLPVMSLGELYFGAYKSSKVEANLAKLDRILAGKVVLDCDPGTAQHYGQIRQVLRTKGRPIPENNIWIAAIARQHQLPLITRDQHFAEVDGLSLERW